MLTGCAFPYDYYASQAIDTENFVEAKRLLNLELAHMSNQSPDKSRILYKLAYVHGKMAEYDSMKYALGTCLQLDGNYTRARREMLDYFVLDEYNRAVLLYNNFFFDKAILRLNAAISMVESDHAYEELAAIIWRSIAFAEASNNEIEKSIEHCRKAAVLGDALSKTILEKWEKERKITPPEKLEKRDIQKLNI